MDILTNNPLANMYGPYFLLFYLALLGIFLFLGRRTVLAMDQSPALSKLPVPETPNPFEIAYLRGGGNEVAKLLVVDLFHRGILVESRKGFFQKTKLTLADNVDLSTLDPTLQSLAMKFNVPRDAAGFNAKSIESIFGNQLERWSKWVNDEQLVFDPEQRKAARRFGYMLIAVFFAVGAYKFFVAIANHHNNVGFLVLLGVVGSVVLRAVVQMPRFTWRGKHYLQDLQTAYASFKSSVLPKPDIYAPTHSASSAWDPLIVGSYAMPVMAMGLFGATALHSAYYSTLRNQLVAPTSGYMSCGFGGGCGAGSACSSGGGCSGGGGGCGGGGCGGGCGGCGG